MADPERTRRVRREWYLRNADKVRAASKAWRERNREKIRSYRSWLSEKNRARKRDGYRHAASGLRRRVLDAYGHKCARCGFEDYRALQVDHVSGGGRTEHRMIGWMGIMKNALARANDGTYQLLCANCNQIKRHERREFGGRRRIGQAVGAEHSDAMQSEMPVLNADKETTTWL